MKLNLYSFTCDFDVASEEVAVFDILNLNVFLQENNLSVNDFKPDFVNDEMNQFIFCIENQEWKQFVNKFYALTETKIVLHHVPTPDGFDIAYYYCCNIFVLEYILNPSYRDRAFLKQVSHNITNLQFIDKIHGALSNPKTSKINSLYKLKMYWNTVFCDSKLEEFESRRITILKYLENRFPSAYCWVFYNIICKTKWFSEDFFTDYYSSSDRLIGDSINSDSVEFEFPF